MDRIYIIEGMTVAFKSYDEAEHWRKWYNSKYYPEYYIEPCDIKWRHLFDTCADAIKWGNGIKMREW